MALRILVVEDDLKIQRVIARVLTNAGYQVMTSFSGQEALSRVKAETPDLVILDLWLPDIDGLEVCRDLRSKSTVPVIILSARGDEANKIAGFTLGADDYVTKPFSPAELVLRVKAVLRRAREQVQRQERERLEIRGLVIDRASRVVELDGAPLNLTAREFDLLWILATHPNRVFSRDQLLRLVWQDEFGADPATVTVLIRRLRQKIEKDPEKPEFIKTVWGVGYKFQGLT